ncbi:MAG: GtrA family protein [Candidatus Marinimicrobia bacterium]|nr:GtrA family protein [Candidatus Neomarinimicrobiota bacterium]MCH7762942.1 GtrA family protein [Candidatus Neomarinimicrobiota bacterium]
MVYSSNNFLWINALSKDKVKKIEKILYRTHIDNTFFQLIRYTFVGGIAFLADFGLLFILTEYFGIHYLISASIGFAVGLVLNYIMSITWVFSNRRVKNKRIEFILFIIIGAIGLGLNEVFLWGFTDFLKIHYLKSKIISTFFIYLWNFFVRKYMLFN